MKWLKGEIDMTSKENLEKLKYKTKNVYSIIPAEKRREMLNFCDEYMTFLDNGKTERECVKEAIKMAEEHGFKKFSDTEAYASPA